MPTSKPARKPASSLLALVLALVYTWAAGLLCWLAYNYLCPRWHYTPLSLTEGIMAWFIILTLRRLFSK
jgi:TRAP-type C4-dicarboxylate transport system permease small subunit